MRRLDPALESLLNMSLNKRKKSLVTGGSGYLGSHVCKLLKENNWHVSIVDIKKPEHDYYDDFQQQDICDFENLNHIFWKKNSFDVVFHFAGKIEVGESVEDPTKYYHTNVGGTCTLLRVMSLFKCKNIIYSSTAGLYRSSEIPLKETDELNPSNNPYAGSKYVAEMSIKQSKLNYVIFRYFNLAGADSSGKIGENHKPETHLIPKIIQNLNNVEIYGNDYNTPDGTCIRDYVHVSDVAEMHLKAAQHLMEENDSVILNLGTGEGYSVKQIVDVVQKVIKQKIKINYLPRRDGDPTKLVSDISQVKKLFNYTNKHTIESIVESAYEWEKNRRPKTI